MISAALILVGVALAAALVQTRRSALEFRRQASTDELTGLLNRASFLKGLSSAMTTSDRVALAYVDLDKFKEINDSLGHQFGDDVLVAVTERLRQAAPAEACIGRLGADEFCVFTVGDQDAAGLASQLSSIHVIAATIADRPIHIRVSIGIADKDETCSAAHELLRRADRAMNVAKSSTDAFVFYHPALDEARQVRREIRNELAGALESKQLKLVYQPLYDVKSSGLAGAEALIRWPGKTGGASRPDAFIAVAEETGLIVDVGRWTLGEALKHIREKKLAIAVNVSPREFVEQGYAERVSQAVLSERIDPTLLKLEITEGVLIHSTDRAQAVIRQLRALGVQIWLDDFGTGYSSLSYLQSFELDGLKIDRSIVRAASGPGRGTSFLKSIIDMGHWLGMRVVAEGVETRRQIQELAALGCDIIQGYAFATPGSIEDLCLLRDQLAIDDDLTVKPPSAQAASGR